MRASHQQALTLVIAAVSGAIASILLIATFDAWLLPLVLGVLAGLAIGSIAANRHSLLDNMMTSAALGVAAWALVNIIALPLLGGQPLQWTVTGMRAAFAALAGWVMFGAALAGLMTMLNRLASRLLKTPDTPKAQTPEIKTRVVVLGGGFAGMTTAQQLEHAFGTDLSVSLTLVSENNALLFTPMLAEVAASSLEPTHISSPLRSNLRRTRVIRAQAQTIDMAQRCVMLAAVGDAEARSLPFDHLVLAPGSVSNYFGNANMERHAFDFKSLGDAIKIRNHVITMFERAESEPDETRRKQLLTFVIAGAGFSGAELAGGLNDFARGMLADYPNIHPDDVAVIAISPSDRILPELSEALAAYALASMRTRGVQVRLNTRVADALPGEVRLTPDERIRTHTLVWTAGTRPHPVLASLPDSVERNKRGAIVVDKHLAVPGQPGLWAAGDCAAVVDAKSGLACPPTAQFALREAHTLAHNIHASLHGRALQSFSFQALGILAVIGHHTACAELRVPIVNKTLYFSGLLAWLLWRGIYWVKLPGLERKVRVMGDWLIELFFPRDIVQTID